MAFLRARLEIILGTAVCNQAKSLCLLYSSSAETGSTLETPARIGAPLMPVSSPETPAGKEPTLAPVLSSTTIGFDG